MHICLQKLLKNKTLLIVTWRGESPSEVVRIIFRYKRIRNNNLANPVPEELWHKRLVLLQTFITSFICRCICVRNQIESTIVMPFKLKTIVKPFTIYLVS